ncbi:hypothetical protein [Haloarcula sp. 1CSR25-25]|jgi:hypothetical protein|uniref:hypothetical protein n=1 Tax=Haloarcula sp. 1CSR25-25 TaxID=2862545 RepID=UPI002894EAA4|nr:hypothetical protein [Haloarcula sp. 1CSR25-25]MDT3433624.1 hypothetical protein [Haloarcula sp. 1CSR25-25]
MTRYETLLEVELDEWDSGYGVLQIVDPDDSDTAELRFCYFNENGKFTNRPLTLRPDEETLDRTTRMVENLGYVARTFDPAEIRELVDTLGQERVIELAQLVDTLGEARLAEILGE